MFLLVVCKACLVTKDRGFAVQVSQLWISLPEHLIQANFVTSFKSLKAHVYHPLSITANAESFSFLRPKCV